MNKKYLFNVECSLGKGSFGEVLKVVSKEDQKTYALKLIELKGKNLTFENVQREIDFMRKIEHPNIVKFVEAFKTDENEGFVRFGIQMEYCSQGDLDTMIKNRKGKKFRSQTMHKWMMEISSAIGYVHGQGIMHRDLKPSNIFLDEYTNIKLGDFGIAKNVLNCLAGTKIGTSLFMAPETFTGSYYIEADVYSMGCVFLCMATVCRHPKTNTGVFVSLPPIVTYGRTKMEIFRRCVASNKDDRPTASDVFQELLTDDYEMLCFHDVRSKNTNFSVNKMVAGRQPGEPESAFVFSNRALLPGEKFCLVIQKINLGESRTSAISFGFTSTDPANLADDTPSTVRLLKQRCEVCVQKAQVPLKQNAIFTFWFESNRAVMYHYDGRQFQSMQNVPLSSKLWAFFNIKEEILQIQLTDYKD